MKKIRAEGIPMVMRVACLLMSLDDPLLCENSCFGYSCGLRHCSIPAQYSHVFAHAHARARAHISLLMEESARSESEKTPES